MQHLYSVIKSVDSTIQVGLYACSAPNSDPNSVWGTSTPIGSEANTPAFTAGIMDSYYPGDSYCDWWGVDVYSKDVLGVYSSVNDYYNQCNYLNYHSGKPFVIGETGCWWAWYPDETEEATFVSQLLHFMAVHNDRIKSFFWYDLAGAVQTQDFQEGLVNHQEAYDAYKNVVNGNSAFIDTLNSAATYTLTINSAVGGSMTPAPGTSTQNSGTQITARLSVNTGYFFNYFDVNGSIETSNPYIFNILEDTVITPVIGSLGSLGDNSSVIIPVMAVALGSVGVPQGDVVEATVHLGATKEVSSWELKLQNWTGKYSPTGAYPLNVGQDGYICIGRGSNCPQLITTRTESVKFDSTPSEHYVTVSGRCWGEKLFRENVTNNYSGYKGETIVKDLLDHYSGISHVRSSVELVVNTDTTFTDLAVQDTAV